MTYIFRLLGDRELADAIANDIPEALENTRHAGFGAETEILAAIVTLAAYVAVDFPATIKNVRTAVRALTRWAKHRPDVYSITVETPKGSLKITTSDIAKNPDALIKFLLANGLVSDDDD